ncbi:MAG: ATP synthase subunit I [Gammaproteobacteria bacterium]|nr:ATP synthase subunit I [Gammaproteobacteria bacterium]MDH5628950.1 ATP synthase subunit I [Gammaproteobacteria bacterium]
MTTKGQQLAFKMILIQVTAVALVAIIALIYDLVASYSLIIGGLICVIPAILFALMAFKEGGAQKAKAVVRMFYAAEAIKFILTIGLFILSFKLMSVNPAMVMAGYVIALTANWISIRFFKNANY